MTCRHCGAPVTLPLIDLGSAPLSNRYLTPETLHAPEPWLPLRVLVCERCWLAQTEAPPQPGDVFDDDYAYFSSTSTSWLAHAQRFVGDAIARFGLTPASSVVEIAANDGYLLQFVQAAGVPCFGIEPTAATAAAARAKGLDIIGEFFGETLARRLSTEGRRASLIVGNNVLAHTPEINDFVRGAALLLEPHGAVSFEFPHLLRLIADAQFDTIYHEHYSYLSLTAVDRIFSANGLSVFDVEELPTHGGSLRVFAQRTGDDRWCRTPRVDELLDRERREGLCTPERFRGFQGAAERIKHDLLGFLLDNRRQGRTVAGYGAAAKGSTLLNFAGVRPDLLPFIVDRSPSKQGKFMPGSRIPIVTEDRLREARPEYVFILPWNIRDEVLAQLDYVRDWGGRFVVASPALQFLK